MTTLPMLLAAVGIGIGHTILPDHWMPLALLARTRRYPLGRVVRLSLAAAVTHVVVSVLFGVALAAVGLRFRETVARHTGVAVGGVLVATGVVLVVLEVLGRGHHHSHSGDDHEHACDHADLPAATRSQLPAQTARQSVRSIAVLERSLAEPAREPEPHHRSLPDVADTEQHRSVPEVATTAHRRRNLLTALAPFGVAASPDLTILPLFLAAGALGVGPALGVLITFALATIAVMVGLTVAAATGASRLTAPWIEERAAALTAATLLLIGALVIIGVL